MNEIQKRRIKYRFLTGFYYTLLVASFYFLLKSLVELLFYGQFFQAIGNIAMIVPLCLVFNGICELLYISEKRYHKIINSIFLGK